MTKFDKMWICKRVDPWMCIVLLVHNSLNKVIWARQPLHSQCRIWGIILWSEVQFWIYCRRIRFAFKYNSVRKGFEFITTQLYVSIHISPSLSLSLWLYHFTWRQPLNNPIQLYGEQQGGMTQYCYSIITYISLSFPLYRDSPRFHWKKLFKRKCHFCDVARTALVYLHGRIVKHLDPLCGSKEIFAERWPNFWTQCCGRFTWNTQVWLAGTSTSLSGMHTFYSSNWEHDFTNI